MSRLARPMWVLAVAAGFAVSATASAAPAAPQARAARSCSVPKYPGSGYFTSLKVSRVGCATGRRLALAYYRCRTRSGLKGRCRRTVLGFSCTETRQSIPTEFDARVRCRRNAQRVIHTYQQDT